MIGCYVILKIHAICVFGFGGGPWSHLILCPACKLSFICTSCWHSWLIFFYFINQPLLESIYLYNLGLFWWILVISLMVNGLFMHSFFGFISLHILFIWLFWVMTDCPFAIFVRMEYKVINICPRWVTSSLLYLLFGNLGSSSNKFLYSFQLCLLLRTSIF